MRARFGIGKADPREHLHGALVRLGLIHVGVDHQRFGNLVADGVERRQRGHRLLEDHGDAPAAQSVHGVALRRQGRDVDGLSARRVVEEDRAARDPGLVRQDLEDGLRGHRLAGAGLADERHRLPFRDVEGQSVDGTEVSGIGAEIDCQLANRQERRFHMLLQSAIEHNALDPIRSQM